MKYRSERLWGEGYRDAAAVLAHEIFELGNTDILDYFFDHHLNSNPKLRDTCYKYADSLYNNGFVDDLNETDKISFCQKLLDEIEKTTGKKIKYCLWLCDTKEDVFKYAICNELTQDDIDAYEESDIILSDIGSEGKLYGYEKFPQPEGKKYQKTKNLIKKRLCKKGQTPRLSHS